MSESIEAKAVKRIEREGPGWAFSPSDLAPLGSRAAIDLALHRLVKKGRIRRAIRGVYIYPRRSELLGTELAPDVDQIARALARKFGWRIQPSGTAAQNIIGLTTQVPASFDYLSDGPDRAYQVGKRKLTFQHTAAKQINLKLPESALIVQALKAVGQERLTPPVRRKVHQWLAPKLRAAVLSDTKFVTGWIYEAIREICAEDRDE